MKRALLIVAMLGGCAAAEPEGAQPAPAARSLSFEANSWGKPLSAWTLESSGRGRYTESKAAPSGNFRDYDLVTRSFVANPGDYRRIEALLAPARAYAGADLPCKLTVTDMVYGKVRWSGPAGEQEVAYNLGCTSEAVTPLYKGFSQAQNLVEQLAEAGQVVGTEEVREPRQ
ncbi:MAG: hypothetical protein WBR13_01645 [Allosphingosinicella sp.]